jgi:two-component system, OmpR family, phosphate regulon response regulator PhoB
MSYGQKQVPAPQSEIARSIPTEPDGDRPAVFMVIATAGRIDKVVGLEAGDSDWIVRPSDIRELLLRIDAGVVAAMEVGGSTPASSGATDKRRRYVVGSLTIDADEHHVLVDSVEVHLSLMEFRLLAYLAERRGRLCTRSEILKDVWGQKGDSASRTLDTHIKRLRDKLSGAGPFLETVRGVGYRLADPKTVSGVAAGGVATTSRPADARTDLRVGARIGDRQRIRMGA